MIEDLVKREKEQADLQKLPPHVYSSIVHSMGDLKNKIETAEGFEKKVLEKELEMISTEFSELLGIRLEKILTPSPQNLTSEEEKVFKEISELIEKYRKTLLTKTVPRMIHVRLTADIPQIMGPNMKIYGPFAKDEDVELPTEVGLMLIKAKLGIKGEEK
jgi:hypothetical protein